ncbi:hypothetical protein [Streptomyces sp. NPDC059906]|uniref:hypothetical protein n=1 Tax=Streptomyces sp. NPDC059906 TaxID=3346997 RepID=UPI003663D35F
MSYTYTSERIFTLWHYTAAHGSVLLLRAKPDATDPRVDLYFQDVRVFLLEPINRGISIRPATPSEEQQIADLSGLDIDPANHVHAVGDRLMRGFIVGGPLQRHEDFREYDEPSHFGPIPGTP